MTSILYSQFAALVVKNQLRLFAKCYSISYSRAIVSITWFDVYRGHGGHHDHLSFHPRFQCMVLLKMRFTIRRFRNPFPNWNHVWTLHLDWLDVNMVTSISQELIYREPHRIVVKKVYFACFTTLHSLSLIFACITTHNKPFAYKSTINLFPSCII